MKNKIIYVVKQYQPSEDYLGQPCAVFDSYEAAEKEAAELNKVYGRNVVLDENDQFVEIKNIDKDWHYYKIEEFFLNKSCVFINE